MKLRVGVLGGVLLLAGACAPSAPVKPVDEAAAIAAADAFLGRVAGKHYAEAYALISPGIKYNPSMRFEQFFADWEAIQNKYGPIRKAVCESVQPVPGKRILQLYYQVTHNAPTPITYHLLAEADARDRITFFLIDIGNAQTYPPGAAGTPVPLKKVGHEATLAP